jgi:hypothetical protein
VAGSDCKRCEDRAVVSKLIQLLLLYISSDSISKFSKILQVGVVSPSRPDSVSNVHSHVR